MPTPDVLTLTALGEIPFHRAWDLQREAHARVVAGGAPELLCCSHPPVYTMGRQTRAGHLPVSTAQLHALGAETAEIDRGGSVTFHGPGQVIGYPIFDLGRLSCGRDLHLFLRGLESALIAALSRFGIEGWRVDGKTGIWTKHGKVAAIGLKCSRWVTMHGYALNLDQDLSWFRHVIPCGLPEPVTSVLELLGGDCPSREAIEASIAGELCHEFGLAFPAHHAPSPTGS